MSGYILTTFIALNFTCSLNSEPVSLQPLIYLYSNTNKSVLLMVKAHLTLQSVRASMEIHHRKEAFNFSLHTDNKSGGERAL